MSERTTGNKKKKKVKVDITKAARAVAVLVIIVWLLVSMLLPAIGVGTHYDRDLLRPYGSTDADAPMIQASSAAMYSLDLDQIVYEKNADEKMAPYSTTKLLTCYLALENLSDDDVVTASKNATKTLADATQMELKTGEQVKVIDLVYAAMLISANDGATALGEAVSGSEEAFADLMNQTVAEWGCTDTHFVNANGWDDENHYTTAKDLVIITKNCLANDRLREISVTKKHTIDATNMSGERKLENVFLKAEKNLKVLTGGKTGSWSESQCSIALEFTDRGLSSALVLLGDTKKGRVNDSKKLIEASHELTPGYLVTRNVDVICSAWVKHGAQNKVALTAKRLCYAYPENGKASGVKVKTEIDKVEAPVKAGDKLGKFYIYANDEEVGRGVLYAAEDVKKGWILSNLYVSNSEGFVMVLIILLIIALNYVIRSKNGRSKSRRKRR